MKKIIYILLLFTICGCSHYYYTETNHKGIGKSKFKKSMFKKRDGSYSSDGIFIKKVIIFALGDTISKRCFTSVELENIKQLFLHDSLLSRESFSIRAFEDKDLKGCEGLYTIRFTDPFNSDYIEFPIIKLKDSLIINLSTKKETNLNFNPKTNVYVKQQLSIKYDSTEIRIRINKFLNGRNRILFSDYHLFR